MPLAFANVQYRGRHAQASWEGVEFQDGSDLAAFMQGKVADRLNDATGREEFHALLRDLPQTGFGEDALDEILDAETSEERDWAVGEALAEALLTEDYGVRWPWNMERDKRNPKASLPGADIVGFMAHGTRYRLALGEVKTSAAEEYPPGVMSGKSGMTHQIDALATNLVIIYQLLKWLHHRCKGNEFEPLYREAVVDFLESGNELVSLFGILIRDTVPNELDLKARGKTLGTNIPAAASCKLLAVYLPHKITELSDRVRGGSTP